MTDPLRSLGRYTLKRRLAAGGMGEVYLGEVLGAANFTKSVAIKRILPHLAANEAFVAKFIDEANVMVQLHHGNIVPVLELADEGGELFIVMEYLPGRDLKAVLHRLRAQKMAFPVDLALWVTTEICDGLDYAHRKTGADGHALNIVHRDVSPSNIMLGAAGEVKLVDFGIARARGGLHQSISGTLQGKFTYMSPEQAEGLHVDARSDIFSTGLVLYEMLCGVRPLEGESETDTLRRVRQANIEPPSRYRPDLAPTVDALVMQALAPTPEARPPSAGVWRREIAEALAAIRSTADATALTRFLVEVFPEGVVPLASEPGPLSVDDALRMQLGSLTPSAEAFGQTRTATGPAQAALAGRRPATFSTPSRGPGEGAPATTRPGLPNGPRSGSVPALPPPGVSSGSLPALPPPEALTGPGATPSGANRMLEPLPARSSRWPALLLLAVVAAGVAGMVFWRRPPAQANVVVTTAPALPKGLELRLDGQVFDGRAQLASGQRVEVCAQARDFENKCSQVDLRPGENAIRLPLAPRTVFVLFEADPPGTKVQVEGLRDPFPQGEKRSVELGDAVKVIWSAEGYRRVEKVHNLFELEDNRVLRERLERLPDGPTPPTATSESPTPPTAPPTAAPSGRGPEGTPPVARPRLVLVESTPSGASVLENGKVIGLTNGRLPAPKVRTTWTFTLPGHRAVTRPAEPNMPLDLKVELTANPPGFITVRVIPAASSLVLDGKDLRTNFLREYEVPAGDHVIRAKHGTREETRTFTLEPREKKVLDLLDVTPEDLGGNGGTP